MKIWAEYFKGTDGEHNAAERIQALQPEAESVGEALDMLLAACFSDTYGENELQHLASVYDHLNYCIAELQQVRQNLLDAIK